MKFGQQLSSEAIPEWKEKYINYDTLKRHLKTIPYAARGGNVAISFSWQDDKLPSNERLFFDRLEAELAKIDEFYMEREEEAIKTKLLLVNQLTSALNEENELGPRKHSRKRSWTSWRHRLSELALLNTTAAHVEKTASIISATPPDFTVRSIDSLSLKPFQKATRSVSQLQKALMEFYRSLLLLQSYQKLNYTAFMKIVKKYDKITNKSMKKDYLKHIESESKVFSSRMVEALTAEVEYIFSVVFAKGNRHAAMRKLRLPDYVHKSYHASAFISGVSGGISLILLICMMYYVFKYSSSLSNESLVLFHIYSLLILPVLMSWLFCILFLVWDRVRINYQFIFEWNARDHLTPPQYANFIGLLSLVFVSCCSVSLYGWVNSWLAPWYHPIAIIAIMLIFLFFPLNIFYASSRRWLFSTLYPMVLPMLTPVRFRDFLLGDIFMSMASLFKAFYIIDSFRRNPSMSPYVPCWGFILCQIIPCYVRCGQCLRRYRDTADKNKRTHLANLLKYTLTMTGSIISGGWFVAKIPACYYIWIVTMLISTLYSTYWDVVMDWGLMVNNRILREHLVYSWPSVYYFALFTNAILRWTWTLAFILPQATSLFVWYATFYICIIGELLRRFQWIFFRVEHEHLHNCGELRAYHTLALPYQGDLFLTAPTVDNITSPPSQPSPSHEFSEKLLSDEEEQAICMPSSPSRSMPTDANRFRTDEEDAINIVITDHQRHQSSDSLAESPSTPIFKRQAFLLDDEENDEDSQAKSSYQMSFIS